MVQIHSFKKDQQGWFIDLKSSPFGRGALAMIAGADTFLDILAEGKEEVTLSLSTDPEHGFEMLERTELIGGLAMSVFNGANYVVNTYKGQYYNHAVYLCPVTCYVFGYYPSTIFFQVH